MGNLRIISESDEPFLDRRQAGLLLAEHLQELADKEPVVLGIPRGGLVVAAAVAEELAAELDIVLTHKIGAPGQPEFAIGAISEDGQIFVDKITAAYVSASDSYIAAEKQLMLAEIARRAEACRKVRPRVELSGRVVIVTDDGVATGATMQAALMAVRRENPATLACALPVGPRETLERLTGFADKTVCLRCPSLFQAVGQFYRIFDQKSDEEVIDILQRFSQPV